MSSKVDPTEWANKRKAAMDRANQLKEERKRGITSGDQNEPQPSFQPQINKRPSYLNNAPKKAEPEQFQVPFDPIFEAPLPGKKSYSLQGEGNGPALSPGSDALGKEVKRVGGAPNRGVPLGNLVMNNQQPSQTPTTQPQFKSKFMQQYESQPQQQQPQQHQQQQQYQQQQQQAVQNQKAGLSRATVAVEADDTFMQQLRGGGGGGGGGWNDDTTTSGTFDGAAKKPAPRRKVQQQQQLASEPSYGDNFSTNLQQNRNAPPVGAYLPSQRVSPREDNTYDSSNNSAAAASNARRRQQQQQQQQQQGFSSEYLQEENYAMEPKKSPRGGGNNNNNNNNSSSSSSSQVESKSRLSLLKSKIKKSEPMAANPSSFNYQQPSMQQQQQGDANNSYLLRSASAEQEFFDVGLRGTERPPQPKSAHANLQRAQQQQQQQQHQQQYYDEYEQPPSQQQTKGGRRAVPKSQAAPINDSSSNSARQGNISPRGGGYDPVSNLGGGREGVRQIKQQQQQPQYQQQQQQQQQQRQQQQKHQQQQQSKQQYDYDNDDFEQEDNNNYKPQDRSNSNPNTAFNNNAPPSEYDDGNQSVQMLQCPDCERMFNPIPYQKHIKICAKVFIQKRKAFDSAKMRVGDNEELVKILEAKKKEERKAAAAARKSGAAAGNAGGNAGGASNGKGTGGAVSGFPGSSNKPTAVVAAAIPSKKPQSMDRPIQAAAADASLPKWKADSNAFREAMKAARQVTKAIESGAPLPPPVISAPDPSLVPCPHCNRRFNQKAADRHIPQCQNIIAKPTSLKMKSGGAGGINGSLTSKPKGTTNARKF